MFTKMFCKVKQKNKFSNMGIKINIVYFGSALRFNRCLLHYNNLKCTFAHSRYVLKIGFVITQLVEKRIAN